MGDDRLIDGWDNFSDGLDVNPVFIERLEALAFKAAGKAAAKITDASASLHGNTLISLAHAMDHRITSFGNTANGPNAKLQKA